MKTTYANMGITISEPYLSPLSLSFEAPVVSILRLDEVHPLVSGNKWFKLRYYLAEALAKNKKYIATFGGGWSNHLVATAAAAQLHGLSSIGYVRGHYDGQQKTNTLRQCEALGMNLIYLSKQAYLGHKQNEKQPQDEDCYFIPEGGVGNLGVQGAEHIAAFMPHDTTHVCVSVGTGTTLVGLLNKLPTTMHVLGFAPLRQGSYLKNEISPLMTATRDFEMIDKWHFGGFGRNTPELIDFIKTFYQEHHIPLDIVYTGKMMYGVMELIAQNYFPPEAKIVCIHTGGVQGNSSVEALMFMVNNF